MTSQIFPGLKPPTSQSFFDIQAFIAENGGRLRLSEKLECEAIKCHLSDLRQYNVPPRLSVINQWTDAEIEILKNVKDYSLLINRSEKAIQCKRKRLGL